MSRESCTKAGGRETILAEVLYAGLSVSEAEVAGD